MPDYFKKFHPVVNMAYFGIVFLCSMFMMHPVLICISLFCAIFYYVYLKGIRGFLKNIKVMSVMLIMIMIINPLFNHEGMTILFYLKSGNPITAESICYGFFMTLLFLAVFLWFGCYNEDMTSDKFVYLFGRIMPHFSLLLSMTLRYVPRFRVQFQKVREAQKCIGRDMSDGNLLQRIRNMVKIISIMISWSFENSIETADSMRARGYGLPGRTAFSIYKFSKQDKQVLTVLLCLTAMLLIGIQKDIVPYRYFPVFETGLFQPEMLIFYGIYGAICLIPLFLNIMEDRKWKHLESNI